MAQSMISFFVDDAAVTAMDTRVSTISPNVVINSGMFAGASNAPGIGISTENPDLQESLFAATDGSGDLNTGSWTLLDQFGNVRINQISQLIGGTGITNEADYPSSGGITAAPATGMGTAPDATIRVVDAADLPTAEEKEADPDVDGSVTLPAGGAALTTLELGWAEGA
jgi:hypothetical protein